MQLSGKKVPVTGLKSENLVTNISAHALIMTEAFSQNVPAS